MKNYLNFVLIAALALSLVFTMSSCQKDLEDDDQIPDEINSSDDMVIADGFDWKTTEMLPISITTQDNYGNPIPNARIEIYRDYDEMENGGDLLLTGFTSSSGVFEALFPMEFMATELYVVTRFIGLPTLTVAEIVNGELSLTIGGFVDKSTEDVKASGAGLKDLPEGYAYLCDYDSQGVPLCLLEPGDFVDVEFLQDIDAALPERAPVPEFNPHYLAEGNQTNIQLLEEADVYVTFLHEGAGYRNSLGFYTYDISNPPATREDIDLITIAFPNLSYHNSGGGLYSGDKLHIGTYPAGTGIGWVLIANGFYNQEEVNTTRPQYFSNPDFNPESDPELRQHNVLLYDAARELYVIGFEDLNREYQGGDNDFNDALFYVTSNPVEAINKQSMPLVDPNLIDTDGDGIPNVMDDYPDDLNLAFDNFYPGRNQAGGLAFEDLWPEKGDYDFNDLVLSYNINQITNADNLVAEIRATYTIEAIGAGFKNGFGFQLDVPPSVVADVIGLNHTGNIISLDANNTESGQSKAVIIPFDNTYNLFDGIGSGFVNTQPYMDFVEPESITVRIIFDPPQTADALGYPPYNSFLIVNQDRGREVHLPGYPPTDLVNTDYFGTGDDDTDPSVGKYYKSATNLPWGMHVPVRFDYPFESVDIVKAHLRFPQWAQSSGFSFMDWYKDMPGYRDHEKIYDKDDE
jgi:LruC domain-containing protein